MFCVAGTGLRDILSTCPKMWSCRFAWQAWYFVTFHVFEVQECREAEFAVPLGKVETVVSAVPVGKVVKTCPFRPVTSCGHVVLRARRSTLLHGCESKCKAPIHIP